MGRAVIKLAFAAATTALAGFALTAVLQDPLGQSPAVATSSRLPVPQPPAQTKAAAPTAEAQVSIEARKQAPSTQPKGAGTPSNPADHERHKQLLASLGQPIHRAIDPKAPLPRDGAGTVLLDWSVLAGTATNKFPIPFPEALAAVDGNNVSLVGYMAPLTDVGTVREFLLLEMPIGCFFCLAPPPNGIVRVELAAERPLEFGATAVRLIGRLQLNRNAPEDFYFSLVDAVVAPVD